MKFDKDSKKKMEADYGDDSKKIKPKKATLKCSLISPLKDTVKKKKRAKR